MLRIVVEQQIKITKSKVDRFVNSEKAFKCVGG